MFKKLLHLIVLPCSTATYLMEKRIFSSLSHKEKIQLRLHILLCKWCRAYDKKIAIIHAALSKIHTKVIGNCSDLQQSDFESIKIKIKEKTKKNRIVICQDFINTATIRAKPIINKKMQITIHNKLLFNSGYYLSYFGLTLIFLWIGVFKFTNAEAEAIQALLENHPASSWLYRNLSYQTVSNIVGIIEILTAVSLLIGLKFSVFRNISNMALISTFVFTLSFLFTTPHIFKTIENIPITDFFILKDILLLGAGLMINNINISNPSKYN